jgi:CBS domain containing-hemolysin-like protein
VGTLLLFILAGLLLLLLNAFFVLAEFAAVKMRPSRVEALVAEGNVRAGLVGHIQKHLDEYLSVCQVGITFASVGLGFVGGPKFADLVSHQLGIRAPWAHTIVVVVLYLLVSFLHILVGELVPKSLAIRRSEKSALRTARPLQVFRSIFYLPLVILNGSANLVMRLLGIATVKEADHSEEELRIILAKSQNTGLMSFRRLLLLENIFDLGELRVRDAMRSRDSAKVLRASAPWEENLKIVRDSRLSRFPLLDQGELPLGVVHVKDLFYEGGEKLAQADLRKIARPYLTTAEDAPLENLLGEFQRHRVHLAVVRNAEGRWTGVISLEDIIEEITGTIEDEFETEPPIHLTDGLTAGRVVLGIDASSLEELIGQVFGRLDPKELPLPVERVVKAVLERERAMSTYLGNGLAVPHARLEGLEKPAVLFARSESGVPIKGREEKAHLAFILLTPAGSPRVQVRLLARVAALLSSEYVDERLRAAESPAAVVEVIRAGEPLTLS